MKNLPAIPKNVIYGLRCTCCPGSGIRYVGQTSVGLPTRLADHFKNARKIPEHRIGRLPVYRWMRKHSLMIQAETLEVGINPSLLDEREQYWVKSLGTFTPGGYNMTVGGGGKRGYRHSAATRAQMSANKMDQPGSGLRVKMNVEIVTEMKHRLWSGETLVSVSRVMGQPVNRVKNVNQNLTWRHVPWPIGPRERARTSEERSVRTGGPGVTAEIVRAIRKAAASEGDSHVALAARFGISRASVGKILRGETWKNVQ